VYAALAGLLVAYLASLILRGPNGESDLVDGWLVAIFEIVASGLCFLRVLGPRRGRAMPLFVGGAPLARAIGDVLLTAESAGGATPSTPSLADAFYLGFYPLMYTALVLLMRREVHRLDAATWMDGLVAGLGAAGVCACFAFNAILHSAGGSAAAVATNLAYPIGDALLEKQEAEAALAEYRKAFAILDQLAQATEGKFRPERELFNTRIRLGDALLAKAEPDNALAEFKVALRIAEPFTQRDASDSTWQSNVSIANKKTGDALKAQDDRPRAIAHYINAVEMSDQVWRKDTTNAEQQVALADNRLALAAAYHAKPDRENARREYREVLALPKSVTTAHPNNRIWARKFKDTTQKAQDLALVQ